MPKAKNIVPFHTTSRIPIEFATILQDIPSKENASPPKVAPSALLKNPAATHRVPFHAILYMSPARIFDIVTGGDQIIPSGEVVKNLCCPDQNPRTKTPDGAT